MGDLNGITLFFLIPGAILLVFFYFAFSRGATRWSLMQDTLIQQYGAKKGKRVTLILFLLLLFSIAAIVWIRHDLFHSIGRAVRDAGEPVR